MLNDPEYHHILEILGAGPPSRVHQTRAAAPFAVFEGCAPRPSMVPDAPPFQTSMPAGPSFNLPNRLLTPDCWSSAEDGRRTALFAFPTTNNRRRTRFSYDERRTLT